MHICDLCQPRYAAGAGDQLFKRHRQARCQKQRIASSTARCFRQHFPLARFRCFWQHLPTLQQALRTGEDWDAGIICRDGGSKLSTAHCPVPWVGPDHGKIIKEARRISADVSIAADILAEGQRLRFPWAIRGARRVALDVARNAKVALDALIIDLGG